MRKAMAFAAAKTAPTAVTWWFAPVGGFLAAVLLWILGAPVTFASWLPDYPVLRGAFDVLVCVVFAYALMFLFWLACSSIHFRFENRGGIRAALGAQMWPIVLMAAGFFAFVALSGGGLIWLVVQNATGKPPTIVDNAVAAPSPLVVPQISESDRVRIELLARTKKLPPEDKKELSAVLRNVSQLFNDADAIRSDATALAQDFYNQRGRSGTIARNLNATLLKLQAMTEAANIVQKKMAPYSQGQYFDRQVNFIFEGSPNELQQLSYETESLSQFMQKWATIQNKNDPDIEALLEPSIKKFSTGFDKVYGWMANCRVRLGQIKEQIL